MITIPLSVKMGIFKRDVNNEGLAPHPDSIETREFWRELVFITDIPVKYIPIHLGIFSTLTIFDYQKRES